MSTKGMLPALALAAMVAVAGCHPGKEQAGGGGGQGEAKKQAPISTTTRSDEERMSFGERLRETWARDLTGSARTFADTYARAPWIHANLAAGDWERAKGDTLYVRDKLMALGRDKAVPVPLKVELDGVKPLIAQLEDQIAKQDPAAVRSAQALVDRLAAITSDARTVAWLAGKPAGGGAGKADQR